MQKRDLAILLLCAFAIFFCLQHDGGFSFREAWFHSVDESYPIQHEAERLPLPLVTDLNGDGRTEILVATHDAKIQILDPHFTIAKGGFAEARVLAEVSLLPDKVKVTAGQRPVAMATGVVAGHLRPGQTSKQVLVVVTAGWSIVCFDHNLKKLWESHVKEDFPHAAHHKEVAIRISNYTLRHSDTGLVIVGGSMDVPPQVHVAPYDPFEGERLAVAKEIKRRRHAAGHTEENEDVSGGKTWDTYHHFSYYAYAGKSGELRWSHKTEDYHRNPQILNSVIPQHNYRLDAASLTSQHDSEVHCREFRESVLGAMPHHWDKREDTHFQLAHFRKHRRTASKKQPGKRSLHPSEKPQEKVVPGKDLSNKVVAGIGKASDFAASSKARPTHTYMPVITYYTQQYWWMPNVVVAHLSEGIEVVHLASGRTLCKLLLGEGGLHADINGDGILDHVQAFGASGSEGRVPTGMTEVVRPCWAIATSGVPIQEALFNASICRHSPYSSFQPGTFRRRWGSPTLSSLEVAAPVLIPRRSDHHHRKGSFGDVVFLTSHGEVTSFTLNPGKGQEAVRKWQIATEASWENHRFPMGLAAEKVVPTLIGLPLRKGAEAEAILVAGESEAVILHPDGSRLTTFSLPYAPSLPIIYEDFSADGLNDLIVVTPNGIYGFLQTRHPGAVLFSTLVGVLIVIIAIIFIMQHLSTPKGKLGKQPFGI